jgi:hypothetical protein
MVAEKLPDIANETVVVEVKHKRPISAIPVQF